MHDPIKTNENIIVQLKDTSNIKVSKYSFKEPLNSELVVNLEEVLQSLED